MILPAHASVPPHTLQINAAALPGADAGAQINAADARLGKTSGTIVYKSRSSANASTPVVLKTNHALVLESPIVWTSAIELPKGSSGQSISCPALQTLGYAAATTWIDATGTSDVALHDCSLMSTLTSAANIAIGGGAINRLLVKNNIAQDTQIVATNSTSSKYADITEANSSSNITVVSNQGHSTSGHGIFILLLYTNQASISSNVVSNYFYGVQWWGGDSCLGGGCTAGGDGASTNPRMTSHLTISENKIMATEACIWGSMGRFLTISGNTCASATPGSGDVGIDLEGSEDSSVTGNTVQGFRNGSLATFFLATRNVWTHNLVYDAAGEAPIGIHNSSQNPGMLTETFTDNTFTCAVACSTLIEATGSLTLSANHFTNVFVTTGFNVSQVLIENNWLTDSIGLAGGIDVTSIIWSDGKQGKALIRGNRIISNAPQSSTSSAVAVSGTDFNHPQETLIDGNEMSGLHPFPTDITCSAASGNSPGQGNYCTITNNVLAADRIVTKAKPNTTVYITKANNHP